MSLTNVFVEARGALGLGANEGESDQAAIKRAYRGAVARHPPDTDPDGFRRIRDAYELLRDPWARAGQMLDVPLPQVPPPAPPELLEAKPGTTAVALLRLAVMGADVTAWKIPGPRGPRGARRKPAVDDGGSAPKPPETT